MPKIEYKSIKFQQKSLELIRLVNQVVEEYQAQGYELTLRQAYYQLVARGYIPNNERSYKNIGNLINDGRLAGLIDWHSITDRTRNLRSNSHWDNPADVIASARYSYLLNKWDGQPNYVEVWVEKDALVDIVGQACRPLDTPYFSCRGYTSQSEMWSAAHPTYETTGGYLKVLDESECGQLWWGSLSDRRKEIIKAIPNFDAEIFFQCTGVRVDE